MSGAGGDFSVLFGFLVLYPFARSEGEIDGWMDGRFTVILEGVLCSCTSRAWHGLVGIVNSIGDGRPFAAVM